VCELNISVTGWSGQWAVVVASLSAMVVIASLEPHCVKNISLSMDAKKQLGSLGDQKSAMGVLPVHLPAISKEIRRSRRVFSERGSDKVVGLWRCACG